MTSFLDRLFAKENKSARNAKERMKLGLILDRLDLSPSKMEHLKDEIIDVISHYFEIDPDAVKIDMTQEGREQRLIADIPLGTTRRRRIVG